MQDKILRLTSEGADVPRLGLPDVDAIPRPTLADAQSAAGATGKTSSERHRSRIGGKGVGTW